MDVSPGNAGTVTVNSVKLQRIPSIEMLCSGEEVTLEAVPAFNYRFDHWSRENFVTKSSDVYDTEQLTSVKAGSDTCLTAHFVRIVPVWLIAVIAAAVIAPLSFLWYRRRKMLA